MTISIPEETGTLASAGSNKKPKAKKKPQAAPHRDHVAPAKAKSASKAAVAKKATKGRPQPRVAKPKVARPGSKTSKMLDLLKRPGGATSKELMKATGWLPHSVRGFLSGTVGKKMGLTVISIKSDDGERAYGVET